MAPKLVGILVCPPVILLGRVRAGIRARLLPVSIRIEVRIVLVVRPALAQSLRPLVGRANAAGDGAIVCAHSMEPRAPLPILLAL